MIGLFGVGNFGNEASLAAALEAARQVLPAAHLTTICPNPARVEQEHGVTGVSMNPSSRWGRFADGSRLRRLATTPLRELGRWKFALRHLRGVDLMVFPGTGVLDDFGTGPGHVPLQILRWSLAARMTGTRVVFLSIGAGPIVNPMSRRLMRAGVAQADFCSYRDEGSRRYMASIGRRTAEDEVWPDLVFALERRTTKPTSDDPFTVALGIMSYRGWRGVGARGDLAHGRYIDRMVALARRLRASGYDLFLVLGDDSDLSSAVAVARELRDPSVDVIKSADLDDVCEAVTKSGLVISSRYHNLIAALLVGVPAISLSYADKNDQLLEAFGLGEYCQTIEDFDVDLVLAHVEAIRGNHAAIVDELGRRVGATRAEVRALLSRQLAGAAR